MIKSFLSFISEEKKSLKARFMSGVKKQSNGCWSWTKHSGTDRVGQIFNDGQARPAHRIAYQVFKGAIPAGKLLRHTCANSRCVNPAHLKVGTKAENNRDTVRDGHHRNQHTGTLKGSPKNLGLR